jgi:intermediate filament protein if
MSEVRITRERTTEGPSTSVRTTTYETRSSYETEAPVYKALMTPRHLVINRTSTSGPASSHSRSVERSVHYGSSMAAPPAGAYALVTSTGVTAVKTSREREKKDMQDLNERFASYIEKVIKR